MPQGRNSNSVPERKQPFLCLDKFCPSINSADEYYITGFLILIGVLLGRFICGFLCPFGWLQELLHKIPTKKLSTKKLKPLTYIKYAVLLFAVGLLPMLITNDVGMGDPFFCKYLCPQGVLEGAIPLAAIDSGIRAALGTLFSWKLGILITVIVLSVPSAERIPESMAARGIAPSSTP